MLRPLTALLCALALVFAACGDDDAGSAPANDAKTTEQKAAEPPPRTGPAATTSSSPRRATAAARRSPGRPSTPARPTRSSSGRAAATSRSGSTRRPRRRPAASFAALARSGFLDDTIFHRIVPGFVIQGGDPTASGTGGPGYSTTDRVPPDAAYVPGVSAMAKAGNEPPGTAGSQFFVVTGPDAGLTPDYALLGKVTKGMDVVQAIGELGDPASGGTGTPLQSVAIEKANVRER